MITDALNTGFEAIGFDTELDECLFLCESKNNVEDLHIKFHLDTAEDFNATGVFFKKELNHYYNPQIYIYDYTGILYDENNLTTLQKKVWSSGNVPLICVFYDTEIKIIDCTTHTKENKPVFLSTISLLNKAKNAYDELFAVKIKTGVFWEEEENINRFNFKNNSSYNILISWIKELRKEYSKILVNNEADIINKVIIQSILIKYLEERKDENGQNLFQDKYFKEYNNASSFVEVLNNNNDFINLLDKLQNDFNGNVFEWTDKEKDILKRIDLSLLSKALNGYVDPDNRDQLVLELIRYYEFSYVPVELISRLYEEFLGEDKRNKGLYYTPSHLARLLVDESMPLKNYNQIKLSEYKILDPACGSGIFLVFAFKRLVQWWRLQQDDFNKKPTLDDLKGLISCIYGIDKEKQATILAAFSLCLALCDELSPLQIITQLKFDDLTQTNILRTDFFIDELTYTSQSKEIGLDVEEQKKNYEKLNKIKFNLVIGNPPFRRSGDLEGINDKFWEVKIGDKIINIPSKQIALKFLVKSLNFLQTNGLQCIIVKSAALIYNPTAIEFKKLLFSQYNVERIFDFTALARNGVLWDNGAEVDTIALFTRNQSPDNFKNILHLTFRRTKSMKERLGFDIDEYDRHFVNRNDAINNPYIWKNNLVGGGRIKTIVEKLNKLRTLKSTFSDSVLFVEGESGAKSLDNKSFCETFIDEQFFPEGYIDSFKNLNQEKFYPPIILVKENITLPFTFNNNNIPYSNEVVGIYSNKKEDNELSDIWDYFNTNLNYLRFYVIATSSKGLVYKNTAIKKEDIENLPYYKDINELLSKSDINIIDDVLNYYQYFLRNGESSKAVKPIPKQEILDFVANYGDEFCQTLNTIYEQNSQKFRLSQVISLYGNSFIGVVFKYDCQIAPPIFDNKLNVDNIQNIAINQISSSLSATRIIKIYEENTIIFIKPNQYRYWLSQIAYRDADKCVVDLSKAGY